MKCGMSRDRKVKSPRNGHDSHLDFRCGIRPKYFGIFLKKERRREPCFPGMHSYVYPLT